MAHAYLIHNTPLSIEEQRQQQRKVFLRLPRDTMCEVLKHTAASFVVTRRTREEPENISLPHWISWPNYIPVLVRYEFRLLPRRECGPEMIARFTLCLDPKIKQSPDWHKNSRLMTPADHAILDRQGAWLAHEFAPFSELRFDEPHTLSKLFCFLRRGEKPGDTEVAPRWSRFDDDVLKQVRRKMETEFRLPLLAFRP
jgi:hypothetical protein